MTAGVASHSHGQVLLGVDVNNWALFLLIVTKQL